MIKGASLDASSTVRGIVSDHLQDYDVVAGPENSWILTMKPQVLTELKDRTLEQSIEAIRQRVDSLGVSEPLIQKNGLGDNQILVQLPGVDDPGRVKEIIQSTARLELREALDHGQTYPTEQAALQAHQGILPANTVVMPSKPQQRRARRRLYHRQPHSGSQRDGYSQRRSRQQIRYERADR